MYIEQPASVVIAVFYLQFRFPTNILHITDNSNTTSIMSGNDSTQHPSLVGGHAEYIKGAAEVKTSVGTPSEAPPWHVQGT